MSSCLYNKEIQIYTYEEYTDPIKHTTKNRYVLYETEEPILVSMQPYSSERAKHDYGYDVVTTKRMFSDIISQIKEDSIIVYNKKQYSVQGEPLDWDDHLTTMLLETKVNLNG
ncbi:hypothetical protein [Clostridium beijerinckii]|uniref:hypothetical protein n=1 Tax=Clostridium beijerinckii TaxID=1520 RepID=UPI00098C3C58|nr:hypothetical protein [Clostridium beijerinckii]NRT78121.1 hypothetical protein [Clostridium beijerinckii]OOM44799.1 hypothetical protein CBEIJ_35450 [Clostridium beijerinckii]